MIEVRNIADFNDYLESLLAQNECDDLEFKSAAGPQGNLNLIKEDSSHMVSVDPNMVSSTPNMASSTPNMASSDPNMPSPMKKKMSRHELQLLILAHCKEWISLEKLSAEISRSPKYLGTYVLPILLASKKLQMLYPGTPKHPKQKYKVAD